MTCDINKIDTWLRENVYTSIDFVYDVDHVFTDDHIDVIASLQNVLHMVLQGEPYDYAYHWTNKVGRNIVNDRIFVDMLERKEVLPSEATQCERISSYKIQTKRVKETPD